jgi:hypothetical protein
MGIGLTLTVTVAEDVHPSIVYPTMVYVVVAGGFSVTDELSMEAEIAFITGLQV